MTQALAVTFQVDALKMCHPVAPANKLQVRISGFLGVWSQTSSTLRSVLCKWPPQPQHSVPLPTPLLRPHERGHAPILCNADLAQEVFDISRTVSVYPGELLP